MSVVGFDFGTHNCTIGVIRNRKLEIATNETSNRYTPNVVGFTNKKREVGETGLVQFLRNAQNSVYGAKFLLGRKFSDPEVKKVLNTLGACRWKELDNGDIGIVANYCGEQRVFTAEQLCASMLTNLKITTEKYMEAPVTTCVVSVPGWYAHKQRKAMHNSCLVANLNPLRIINDLSAVAFNYGFYNPSKFDEKSQRVLFVSMGRIGFQCSIVEFSKPSCSVKAYAYDLSIGGGMIDELLCNFFVERFNKKNGCDVSENKRAVLKVLLAVERTKKTLNVNAMSPINQDCLYEGIDLSDKITKEEYVKILSENTIHERVIACVGECLKKAKMDKDELMSIEWVGSGMRVQSIRDAIEEFCGKPLSSTMNAEEAVAMGCALMCARLSPTASTRPYDLIELNNNDVSISWSTLDDPTDTKLSTATLFPAGYVLPTPKARNSTFSRPDAKPIQIELKYQDVTSVPLGCQVIGVCKIAKIPKKPDAETGSKDTEVRVKFRAEPNGLFSFVQADMLEQREEDVEVPVKDTKKEKADSKKEKDGEKEEAAPEGEAAKMETEEPATKTEKRKVEVCTKLTMETIFDELSADQIQEYKKIEMEMRMTEQAVIDALDAKNGLETFVYALGDKLSSNWASHTLAEEKSFLQQKCDETSAWLYGDGDDCSKSEYDAKKLIITDVSDKIELRSKEWEGVPLALDGLSKALIFIKTELALREDEKYSHIDTVEMDKVGSSLADAEKVFEEASKKKAEWVKTQDPPVLSSDLNMRAQNLLQSCTKILNTPKPTPPEPEVEPATEEKMEEEQTEAGAATEEKEGATEGEKVEGEGQPASTMETDVD